MTFIPNPHFITDFVTERPYKEAMTGAVEQAAKEANRLAHDIMPSGKGAEVSAEWIDGDCYLVNHAHGGHIDEWGSVNSPPYAPLRTAVRRAGFELIEE